MFYSYWVSATRFPLKLFVLVAVEREWAIKVIAALLPKPRRLR